MAVAKKKAVKRAKKVVRKRAARRPIKAVRLVKRPPGYVKSSTSALLVPEGHVVDPSKLRKGLTKAKDEINDLIQEVIDTATTDYSIHEIEFAASFSADGKFMGIGVGGAATITFRIRPCS